MDINLRNRGSGASLLVFNRMFETVFRGSGLSQFRTAGAFFDLNVYAETYLHAEMTNGATRVQIMDKLIGVDTDTADTVAAAAAAAVGGEDAVAAQRAAVAAAGSGAAAAAEDVQLRMNSERSWHFLNEQADGFVWAVAKMIHDAQAYADATSGGDIDVVLDQIIPSGEDLSDAFVKHIVDVVLPVQFKEAFTQEMTRRRERAKACVGYVCLRCSKCTIWYHVHLSPGPRPTSQSYS